MQCTATSTTNSSCPFQAYWTATVTADVSMNIREHIPCVPCRSRSPFAKSADQPVTIAAHADTDIRTPNAPGPPLRQCLFDVRIHVHCHTYATGTRYCTGARSALISVHAAEFARQNRIMYT